MLNVIYAKCYFANNNPVCHNAEFLSGEWHYAKCNNAECHNAELLSDECHYADCRGAQPRK